MIMLLEKKILIIVHEFPPEIGGGGVMRTVKLVKYLPDFGWCPIVLTVDRKDSWMPDLELLNEISGTEVYRCKDMICKYNTVDIDETHNEINCSKRNFSFLTSIKSKLKNVLKSALVPDQRVGWLIPAIIQGKKIIKDNEIDLIYTTAPPHTPLLVGCILSILTGKKLVVDFRDAWVGNKLFTSKYWYKNFINKWLEILVLRRAELIITTTKQVENDLRNKTSQPVVTIPNGYDPEDFVCISPLLLDPGKVNLIYLGGFSGVRTSQFFVRALTLLQDQLKESIAIYIVGEISIEETALLQSINDVEIHLCGTFPHKEALRYLISADILILFIFKEEDSKSAIPGKIYEYLAAQKPIIAFCDSDSALANLLYDLGVKYIVTPDNVDEIIEVLSTVVSNYSDVKIDYSCSLFDRKKNTQILSSYFNSLTM